MVKQVPCCIFMYVRMHICIHVYMYVCMHVRMFVCLYAYMYARSYVCLYLQTKTGGKLMMRHDRSRGGNISAASSTITSWSRGILLWSPTPASPTLLYFSSIYYIYVGLLPPCLILDVSAVDWIINIARRLLLIIYLPCSLFLYVTFRSIVPPAFPFASCVLYTARAPSSTFF